MEMRDSILELLSGLEDMELNVSSYYEDGGLSSFVNSAISGRLRALAAYLRQLGMPDLLEVVLELDPEPSQAVYVLEIVRSYVGPELRRRLQGAAPADQTAYEVAPDELIAAIEAQRALMIAVATDGPRIQAVDGEYIERRGVIARGLDERDLRDPNPYSDLWAWYGKWSSGDLPRYGARRDFIRQLYDPMMEELRSGPAIRVMEQATGWERVDRGVDQIRRQLRSAKAPEQFQAVGLVCREVLISLGQEVYDPGRHGLVDGVAPSSGDAKRMLAAFIAAELAGSANEVARKHAKAALDLANRLQHERTADFRDAALCAEATISVANIVAVISGKRGN
jgi:hypothetical protein